MKSEAMARADGNDFDYFTFVVNSILIIAVVTIALISFSLTAKAIGSWDNFKWQVFDWPDTASMARMFERGQFFSSPPMFINGESIFGLFPPFYYVVVSFFDLFFQDVFVSMFVLSILLQLATTYLIVRDWKNPHLALFIVLVLNFNALTGHYFPVVIRLRELLGVFLMVLMFKNPLKINEKANFAAMSLLLALTQPMVWFIGALGFILAKSDWSKKKLDPVFILSFLLSSLAFVIAYHKHILIKLAYPGASACIGCLGTVITFLSSPLLLSSFFLVVAPFFLLALDDWRIKLAWAILVAALLAVVLLQVQPSLLFTVLSPLKEDLCIHLLYPAIAFVSLFPPKNKKIGKLASIVLMFILVLQAFYSMLNPFGLDYKTSSNLLIADHIQPGSKVLTYWVYFWEPAKLELFKSFHMQFMGESYLRNVSFQIHYSPMQQFYDTNNLLPDATGFFSSLKEKDAEKCKYFSSRIREKEEYIVLFYEISSFNKNHPWTENILDSYSDAKFAKACGATIIINSTDDGYVLYKFNS